MHLPRYGRRVFQSPADADSASRFRATRPAETAGWCMKHLSLASVDTFGDWRRPRGPTLRRWPKAVRRRVSRGLRTLPLRVLIAFGRLIERRGGIAFAPGTPRAKDHFSLRTVHADPSERTRAEVGLPILVLIIRTVYLEPFIQGEHATPTCYRMPCARVQTYPQPHPPW